jgi:hypothetical protein
MRQEMAYAVLRIRVDDKDALAVIRRTGLSQGKQTVDLPTSAFMMVMLLRIVVPNLASMEIIGALTAPFALPQSSSLLGI